MGSYEVTSHDVIGPEGERVTNKVETEWNWGFRSRIWLKERRSLESSDKSSEIGSDCNDWGYTERINRQSV